MESTSPVVVQQKQRLETLTPFLIDFGYTSSYENSSSRN